MKYQFRVLLPILIAFLFLGCKKDAPINNTPPNTGITAKKPHVTLLWRMGSAELSPKSGLSGQGVFDMKISAIAAIGRKITGVKILLSVDNAAPIQILDSTIVPVESFTKLYEDMNILNVNGNNLLYTAIAVQDDGKIDSNYIILQKPKVTFLWNEGSGYTTDNGNIKRGTTLAFKLTAKPTGDSLYVISSMRIYYSINNEPKKILFDTGIFTFLPFTKEIFNVKANNLAGSKITYTASVTMQSTTTFVSAITEIPITLTINNSTPLPVKTTANVIMGAQGNTGSFFNPAAGTNASMTLSQAQSNPANVHIIYYSGTTHKETFSAPADAQITQIFPTVANWFIRNNTQFKKTTLTAADFDNIPSNNSTVIDSEILSGAFSSKVTQLQVGNVIAYISQDQTHYGLLKITSITPGSSGNVVFVMKSPVF